MFPLCFGTDLVAIDNNGVIGYYHTDEHGNVSAITDVDRTVVADYDFDAFGNELTATESYYNPMRYCGEYYDAESSLTYLRARYYDPSIGRFISEDPIKDGMNWYVYCGNNPIAFVDPWGLSDYYIFYGDYNQKLYAQITEEQIKQSNPDAVIHVIKITSASSFYKEWSAMGTNENGDSVDITGVFIMLHGEAEYIHSPNGSTNDIYIDNLECKTIGTILLSACNTGNLNFPNNVASQLLMSQNVDQVIAPDGYGHFYLEKYLGSFYGSDYDNIDRKGNGFSIFQNINGSIYITPNLTKDGEYKPMVDIYRQGVSRAITRRITTTAVDQAKSIINSFFERIGISS